MPPTKPQHIEETLYHNQLVPSADSVRERTEVRGEERRGGGKDPQLPRRVPLGAQSLLRSFIGSESSTCVRECACEWVGQVPARLGAANRPMMTETEAFI
jgi:hypothetical protein